MISSPGFDPNNIAPFLSDPNTPLVNRAIRSYPPGSVFKLMTALAGLESGALDPNATFNDQGQLSIGKEVFRNWYFTQYGKVEGDISLVRAIARSNDTYFYNAAKLAGPEAIAKMAGRFHFGVKSGIELAEEDKGLIPTPTWKDRVIGEKWYLGDTYHMGIGQGDVLATPLQVNQMTAAIARGGTWCQPTLQLTTSPQCEDLNLKAENMNYIIQGMLGACTRGGTAFPFFPFNDTADDEHKVACKTGTAEIGPADAQGRKHTHGWFTMFYPIKNPKIAITVMLEATNATPFLEGSTDGAPIAKQLLQAWMQGI
jgi:penicillin-binding protein 2